jgi:hypothetical protein
MRGAYHRRDFKTRDSESTDRRHEDSASLEVLSVTRNDSTRHQDRFCHVNAPRKTPATPETFSSVDVERELDAIDVSESVRVAFECRRTGKVGTDGDRPVDHVRRTPTK